MTQSERIDYIIRECEGNNASAFARRTNIHVSDVSRIRTGRIPLGNRLLRVLYAYPQVRREWLVDGEGDPFAEMPETKDEKIARLQGEVEDLTAQLRTLRKVIDKLLTDQESLR